MKRNRSLLFVLIMVVLVQMACSLPSAQQPAATPFFVTPTGGPGIVTATPGLPTVVSPATQAPVVTATQAPADTQAPAATATKASSGGSSGNGSCTFLATFIGDVSVPDDTRMAPGASFTKTWRVRNDGTCTWGPNLALHALAFTGGSHLDGPDQVSLGGKVASGQTVDLSVNLVAPAAPGTYTSEWKFRVDGVSGVGPFVGLGSAMVAPLYARIVVGPTPTPTKPPAPATRITFATGATHASVDGSVKAGAKTSYLVKAGKGQLMMVTYASAATDLTLKVITEATGKVILTVSGMNGQVFLPATGDYRLQFTGGSADASFTLGVTIPSRITFDSGATSASVDGKISSRQPVTYLLRALKDQTMTVKLTSPSNAVFLTIYGLDDGQPLVRAEQGLSEWSGKLPATQDYVIMAYPSVDSTTFTLKVTVK